MSQQRTTWILSSMLGLLLAVTGCSSAQKDATDAAVNAAQQAVNSAKDAAAQYAPEQFKAAQDALQSAKDALGRSDYQGALSGAKAAVQKAREAISAAGSKKEEWAKDWRDLSASAPRTLNEAKSRLETYEKIGRRPPGVSSDDMREAKAQYEKLKDAWDHALTSYQNGNLAEAMKNAGWVQEGLQKLRDLLGIKS